MYQHNTEVNFDVYLQLKQKCLQTQFSLSLCSFPPSIFSFGIKLGSTISIIVGNVVALVQTNIKRMLAYSTIANVGFILIGIYSGSQFGYQASLFYTVTYVLFTVSIFGIITQLKYNNHILNLIVNLVFY